MIRPAKRSKREIEVRPMFCNICRKEVGARVDPRGSMLYCPHCRCCDLQAKA